MLLDDLEDEYNFKVHSSDDTEDVYISLVCIYIDRTLKFGSCRRTKAQLRSNVSSETASKPTVIAGNAKVRSPLSHILSVLLCNRSA